ncbi:d-lactaldehyde dehydrogenase [Moniliophthora roreri MCA 2997]|uniref:D-lactaldehyde dehydrogenase n=1 Tax=Moniliophthora roreri (strain MCA 2997) TaxID=1381753 RepID=V2XRF3_MONRO|nr:d-lactaldehyde dehydrogenase [Moniliophthora roreri MCA 2997]
MPAFTNSPSNYTVLVTGANGYIAAWIVAILLERGYTVHATVRSESRGEKLLETHKASVDSGKLKLVIVKDMQADGAWDEAVKGVDAILHTAAQTTHVYAVEDPREVIDIAVEGVTSLMTSALKHGSTVQRIVFTSSTASVIQGSPTSVVSVSESDWNEESVKNIDALGKNADFMTKYAASKTLAEKAIWEWHQQHKAEVAWDIAVINPVWVFGPVAHAVKTPDDIVGSQHVWCNAIVRGEFMGGSSLTYPSSGWVDVRDVAEAHALALEVSQAGGERIITCAGSPFVWQDFVDVANSLNPPPLPGIAKGMTGDALRNLTFKTSKAQDILGVKYRTMEELTKDSLEQCAQIKN